MYVESFQQGHLVLPASLLFRVHDLFPSTEDFLVWQFFFLQDTSQVENLVPSQIAKALGKSVSDINRSIEQLQAAELLDFKTIELAGEIEMVFDAFPALKKLENLLANQEKQPTLASNPIKNLVEEFERELGRLLSPLEIEDLQKTIQEDQVSIELIREALKEAVFNNKTNWRYIQAILRNWRREGITTLSQVAAKQAEREAQNHPQPAKVSEDFLTAMNVWKE